MSMLSAQVDRLRELATRCDELQVGVVKAVTMPSDMGSILREAADTIWQLRDDLQRENAENAKLRQQLADVTESMGRVEERCAKLRELCADLYDHAAFSIDYFGDVYGILPRMRELGVEVPE